MKQNLLLAAVPFLVVIGCRDEELAGRVDENASAIEETAEAVEDESGRANQEDATLAAELKALSDRVEQLEADVAANSSGLEAEIARAVGQENELNSVLVAAIQRIDALENAVDTAQSDLDVAESDLLSLSSALSTAQGQLSLTQSDVVALSEARDAIVDRLSIVQEEIWVWDGSDYLIGKLVNYNLGSFIFHDAFDTFGVLEYFYWDQPAQHDSALYYLTDNCTGTPYMVNINGADLFAGVVDANTGKKYLPVVGYNTVTVSLRGRRSLAPSSACQALTPQDFSVIEYVELGTPLTLPLSPSGVAWNAIVP